MAGGGIDFAIIPVSWKDCTGYSRQFASEKIENFVTFPAAGFETTSWAEFRSPHLKESLFHEAQHYIDRSLYHLLTGKWMVCEGRLTWGLVSFYYSSFFATQAAIRFAGIFFVKVNYDSETVSPPTHRLEVINLVDDRYRIRRAGSKGGEHQRVWNVFYELFAKIMGRPGWAKFAPITTETNPEERLIELHRRHLLNYVPSKGYFELISQAKADGWRQELEHDLHADLAQYLNHDDGQLECRALLRLEMCLRLVSLIAAEKGVYELHHGGIVNRRRSMLQQFNCPNFLQKRIDAILAV